MRQAAQARCGAALGLLLLCAVAPSRAWADDAEKSTEKKPSLEEVTAQADQYPPFSSRFKVLTAGLLVTGMAWGVSFAAARGWPENTCHITVAGAFDAHNQPCQSGPPGTAYLQIPVVGPWITLGKSGCPTDNPTCGPAAIGVRAAAFILDGIVQAAGFGLMLQAIFMKTEPPGGNKASAFALHYRGLELKPMPVVTPGMSGLGVVGTF
jgi:hypothetical protein